MASLQELKDTRLEKIKIIKDYGMDPYPASVPRTHSLAQVKNTFEDLKEQSQTEPISVAGRVMAIRGQGAILFVVLKDGDTRFQTVLKKDVVEESLFNLFIEAVDMGDFISVTGSLFTTDRGENSLLISTWQMATKSLLPLPDKWSGLQDIEEKFRKRYLDIMSDDEVYNLFILKSKFWNETRSYLIDKGFLEVETPTLEITTGGAEARPFKTHHNDFDIDVFLRISVGELWQKRLMSAGYPRTFEIGRVYRNEGSSPEHVQEFTNLEFYASYMDYKEGMIFTRDMIRTVVKNVFGKTKFETRGHSFDLADEWQELDYVDTVRSMTGINVLSATEDEMKQALTKLEVQYTGDNKERLTDTLWKYCRKQIAGPAYVINHPKIISPLSKANPNNPELTERVQLILAGAEVTNGFSELNDPVDQRARFELQKQLIESGDDEAMMPEWEFVEMLEHGMPPTFGFAYGERLFAFLVDKPIREVQMFPLMKPRSEE